MHRGAIIKNAQNRNNNFVHFYNRHLLKYEYNNNQKETKKTANLFRRNSDYEDEITITKAQAEKVIEKIEKAWVQE